MSKEPKRITPSFVDQQSSVSITHVTFCLPPERLAAAIRSPAASMVPALMIDLASASVRYW